MQTTITEALAELKTIEKRVEKKRQFCYLYLLREERLKDPLARDGGSEAAVLREMQSIQDLAERRIIIRRRIQEANAYHQITVGKTTRSIADWLVWKRDVAPGMQKFLSDMRARIELARQEVKKRGGTLAGGTEARPEDIVVNYSENELAKNIESLEEALGTLDGQLSLKNATTFIDI